MNNQHGLGSWTLWWVNIGTGMKVWVVLIDVDKKKILNSFFSFLIGYFFEDLQKNAVILCGYSDVSECHLCCVSCLLRLPPLPLPQLV
jgi:hypothetical protein